MASSAQTKEKHSVDSVYRAKMRTSPTFLLRCSGYREERICAVFCSVVGKKKKTADSFSADAASADRQTDIFPGQQQNEKKKDEKSREKKTV